MMNKIDPPKGNGAILFHLRSKFCMDFDLLQFMCELQLYNRICNVYRMLLILKLQIF